jgi:hypothetical protein
VSGSSDYHRTRPFSISLAFERRSHTTGRDMSIYTVPCVQRVGVLLIHQTPDPMPSHPGSDHCESFEWEGYACAWIESLRAIRVSGPVPEFILHFFSLGSSIRSRKPGM